MMGICCQIVLCDSHYAVTWVVDKMQIMKASYAIIGKNSWKCVCEEDISVIFG